MDEEELAARELAAARDGEEEEYSDGVGGPGVGGGAGDSANTVGDPDDAALEDAIAAAVGADPARREDDKLCSTLFKGSVFFIQRECPKDMMIFVITSFGGDVAWDGEGSPHDASDGGITHVVADRPMDGKMASNREYVVPQWVVDCANWRVLIPTEEYKPGTPPPPHLSPFVNSEEEGYTPDYEKTLRRLKALARAAREGRSLADVSEEDGTRMLTAAEEAAEE